MPIYVPVDPALDDAGRLRVLVPLLGDAARPFPDTAPTVDASTGVSPDTKYYQTTVQAAASLGVGDIFKLGADGFCDATIMDTVVGIPRFRSGVVAPTDKVLGTYWGFSVRVAMKVRTLHATGSANLANLAASVELGTAEIHYSISAMGIDRKIFATALRGVPLFGKLDYATYAKLQTTLDDLSLALADRLTREPLLPIGVFLRDDPFDDDVVGEGRSVRWAMSKLASKTAWADASQHAPAWLDLDIAKDAFREVLGQNLDVPVDSHAQDLARTWLKVG